MFETFGRTSGLPGAKKDIKKARFARVIVREAHLYIRRM